MSSFPLRWAAIALVFLAVLFAGGLAIVYASDDARPTTATLNLRDGQREVPSDQTLVIKLSRPATTGALARALTVSPAATGDVGGSGSSFTWRPTTPLQELTAYTIRLAAFTDSTGHAVKPAAWHFTTTIVPRLVALQTPDKTEVAAGAEVELGAMLVAVFNEPLADRGLKLLAGDRPLELTWSPDGRSAGFSLQGFGIGPLRLSLGPGATDGAGRAVAGWTQDVQLAFRIHVHTVPLRFPALVQIPNDGYGARDQSGYQAADMVFEYLTEGGITRTTAVYTNAPDVVGPVRSGRYISFYLTRHYRGMLYLSGLSNPSYARLHADPVPAFFDAAGYYYRDHSRAAPNNLYLSGDAIQRAENSVGVASFDGLDKGVPALTGGAPAAAVTVAEHGSRYAYDATTGTYGKVEGGHTMVDAALHQPLRVFMLIVFHTREWITGDVEDVGGGHARDFDMDGGGSVEIYYQGQQYGGRWSAPNRSSPYVFTVAGQPVKLPLGLVWIDVVS